MFHVIYFWVLLVFGFNLCLCLEDAWYSYQSELKDASREELVVINVTADENFKVDYNVTKWTSLSAGPVCYTVGLMESGITILFTTLNSDTNEFSVNSQVKQLGKKPLDVILLKVIKGGMEEITIIVAFCDQPQLDWYKVRDNDLVLFSTWPLKQPVVHLNSIKIKDKNVLLLANNSTTVDLYEYEIKENDVDYWVLHSLRLPSIAESSAFNNFEYNYYLSIPQKSLNVVLVYRYEGSRFLPYKNITSKKVNSLVSFEIVFKSFLAIDGHNAGIYQFTRKGMIKEKIVNSNLDGINYWLPVPVTTYRDEVILFAQRKLDHSTHQTPVVDIFTYSGGKFEEHEDVSCSHFGEQQLLLSCLTQRNGIIGSSYIAVGDKLSLIVPDIFNTSLLFVIHSAIKQMPNPKEKEMKLLIDRKEKLEKLINANTKKYQEIRNLYKISNETEESDHGSKKAKANDTVPLMSRKKVDIFQLNEKLEEIGLEIQRIKDIAKKIVDKENKREFNTVTINGRLEIEGHGKFREVEVVQMKGIPATELLEDVVRKDSIRKISGNKIFTDLKVDNISFDSVNGIGADDIATKKNSSALITGDVIIKRSPNIQNIHVRSGKINDIDLKDEVIDVRKEYGGKLEFETVKVIDRFQAQTINNLELHFDDIDYSNSSSNLELNSKLDTVFISQNLSVVNVNGENFEDFLSQLCLININCYIPGHIKINGNITVENETSAQYLNKLMFPQEYILIDSVPYSNITGKKVFKKSLTAKEVRCRGAIDGLDTKKLITLSTDQEVSGKIVFKDVEVTEALNVSGNILGEHVDKFLPNPTLQFVGNIKSNVNFKNVEVNGNIVVENNLNSCNFEMLLKDAIYKDEDNVTIISQKDIPEGFVVKENFEVESNSINNINIDSLVTKDTDQTLDISFLKGDVVFENIIVNGTYNDINVTRLDQDLVKLTGEQYISSTLILNESIEAENFEITGKLNDLRADEYLYADGDREIEKELEFETIEVRNILVEGNFEGELSEIDLDDFNSSYLSYSKDQIIDFPYNIRYSTVDNLRTDRINDNNYDDLFDNEKFLEKVIHLFDRDQLKIGKLYVNGSVEAETMNNENMSKLLPVNILMDQNGENKKNFSVQGNIYVDTLEIDKLSNVNWNGYVKGLIYKDEVNTVLESPQVRFTKGFEVDKLIETEELNDIPLENILTKEGRQEIKGPITVEGDATFEESIAVAENVNGVSVTGVLGRFDVINDTFYTIQGDFIFSRLPHIYNLTVIGDVNNKNATEILRDVVNINEDSTVHGETTFETTVKVSGNFAIVHTFNGINISELVPRIVLTTKDTEVQGLVTFSKPVFILEHLTVETELTTNTLYGIDLREWKNNSVFVDHGLLYGNYTFEEIIIKDSLITKFINDIDMKSIIPLRANQSIDYLEFEEVSAVNNIAVGNLVNGYYLPDEYEKTVMVNLNQEIPSKLIFQNNVLIRQNINTPLINSKDVSKIVNTDTDQNLTSIFNFSSRCRMDSDVHIYGLLNGIDVSSWVNSSVKIYSPELQEVYDNWNVSKNFTFNENVEGLCLVNGLNLTVLADEVEEKRNYKYEAEQAIIDDYKNMCIDVRYLYEAAKKQIFKFKYFEELQTLSFTDYVQQTHYFRYKNDHYLLVNLLNCSSHLLIFNGTAFLPVSIFETGHISQIISVFDGNSLYLITRDADREQECEVLGTNVWEFNGDNVTLEYNMENQDLLQDSQVPATFYGMDQEKVTEYKIIKDSGPKKYRTWKVFEENAAFVPRGLQTDLALRTGLKLVFLDRSDPLVEASFNVDTESVIIGNFSEIHNHFIPGRNGGDLVVTKVGIEGAKRNLLAVATHEETSVKRRLDLIKIYGDALKGELSHMLPSYKPSSLVSVEFGQGETLLAFMENGRTLQVYEYKGIEGFKHRSSSRIKGSKLFLMTLPIKLYLNPRITIGIVNENTVTIIQSVMIGNQIRDNLKCGL